MAAGLLLFAFSVIGFVQNQVWLETPRGGNAKIARHGP